MVQGPLATAPEEAVQENLQKPLVLTPFKQLPAHRRSASHQQPARVDVRPQEPRLREVQQINCPSLDIVRSVVKGLMDGATCLQLASARAERQYSDAPDFHSRSRTTVPEMRRKSEGRHYSQRRSSRTAFKPPNANEFESAARMRFSRATLGT